MTLNLKGFSQLLQDMTAALQGAASAFVDVSVGSVLRAIFEANASVALWLQWLIVSVLQTTRAATSTGADLDSWMNDFGVVRLPATASTGPVTFSRFSSNLPAFIPVGTVVKTTDGSLSFVVTADTTISNWQASNNGYAVPSGVPSTSLPVACLTSGSIGNVLAGAISIIASSLPGVDQVTNGTALTDGADAETDAALRSRFHNFLGSLSRATPSAIRAAVASVQQNLNVLIQENAAEDGSLLPGSFLLTVDDGSGEPSSALLSLVADAVERVRPISTRFAVLGPQVLVVNVQLTVYLSDQSAAASILASIQGIISDYLNTLKVGAWASMTRVAQAAYTADARILNVSDVALNGQSADLTPPARTVIKAGDITVSIDGR